MGKDQQPIDFSKVVSRGDFLKRVLPGIGGALVLGGASCARPAEANPGNDEYQNQIRALQQQVDSLSQQLANQGDAASTSEIANSTSASVEGEGPVMARAVPVPEAISGDMVRAVREDGVHQMFEEGTWFHPVYDPAQADKAHDYRGIGPWYPVAYEILDSDAAVLTTHGNVGELVISGRKGGHVMVAFMQLDKHQTEGAWGTDQATGRFVRNDKWAMQYNFHGLNPLQEIWVVDPDTGRVLSWPGESPVLYRANEQGIAAFAIPKTNGQDVRVGFVFKMNAAIEGVQPPEVKIERGPNDRPELKGENPLPDSVKKPMVAEK